MGAPAPSRLHVQLTAGDPCDVRRAGHDGEGAGRVGGRQLAHDALLGSTRPTATTTPSRSATHCSLPERATSHRQQLSECGIRRSAARCSSSWSSAMTAMSAVVARRTLTPGGASTRPVSACTRGIGIA